MEIDFNAAMESENRRYQVTTTLTDPFDMETVKAGFAGYLEQINTLNDIAAALVITDDKSATEAVSMTGKIKKLSNQIEKERKVIIDSPSAFVKNVNNFVKSFSDPLQMADKTLRSKISNYQYQLDLERRKREEDMRRAQAELQARLDAEAKKNNVIAPQVIDIPVKEEKPIIRTEQGSASIRKTWKGEIVSAAEVPAQYCSPDQKKIDEAIKAGIREIPGVRIYEHITTVMR